jgi:hypothetical protein
MPRECGIVPPVQTAFFLSFGRREWGWILTRKLINPATI